MLKGDPEIDRILASAGQEMDQPKRNELYKQFQRLMLDKVCEESPRSRRGLVGLGYRPGGTLPTSIQVSSQD